MATLDYIDIPPGATRLRPQSAASTKKNGASSEIRPAPRIITPLPHPSPPPSPGTQRASLISTSASSLTSPTMSLIPQLLLSSTIPGLTGTPGSTTGGTGTGAAPQANPRKDGEDVPTLLSSRDPLSVPIMTVNFKRFVSIVGPIFWVQDRIEEIVFWKRGWRRTAVWMAVYAFICFFPRLILLLPHIALVSVILATYPYPANPDADPLYFVNSSTAGTPPADLHAAEGSVPWQANIQAIQNLMGAVADLHDFIEPHLFHLRLTPLHIRPSGVSTPRPAHHRSRTLSNASQTHAAPAPTAPISTIPRRPRSPYTAHLLTLLVLTFFPLLFFIHLPWFPLREVALIAGLAPFAATHPRVQAAAPVLLQIAKRTIRKKLVPRARRYLEVAACRLWLLLGRVGLVKPVEETMRWTNARRRRMSSSSSIGTSGVKAAEEEDVDISAGSDAEEGEKGVEIEDVQPLPVAMVIQRVLDDDRLTDECWNAEMREVQLWENERYGGLIPGTSASMPTTATVGPPQRGWSKQNLRPGERAGWTRGRDGWNGVGGGGDASGSGFDEPGAVSSNLTFSLAPGWRFIETEDWRKDTQCAWSGPGVGGDPDGWVYTNDAWVGPRAAPYTAGGGSVTRRRRWIRRVWYDAKRASEDS
ncbi:hypothetical protein D9619_012638 [Psilocybe cf. subviscida]|uniref:TECPR1-like DysF domain-containing protein n=1 Tax=Psilocybe cf. subviscida TaxID=2480587 RepID=A0A8H5EZ88_9AGAR|nr:hypothetical protein D9619_012638 [Psilocybe cf. subviscida]